MIRAMGGQQAIEHLQPEHVFYPAAAANDPLYSRQWAMSNTGQEVAGVLGVPGIDIGAQDAWDQRTSCEGVTVAVIDSGVNYAHEDLAASMWSNPNEVAANGLDDDGNGYVDDVRGWDFVQGDNDPFDPYGHGTAVAGLIGAAGNNSIGVTGVCWQARIMPLRVLNESGYGSTGNIVAAVQYAVANGARVINMSLVSLEGSNGDLLYQALDAARAAGVLVVTAAGNQGADTDQTPVYPAGYDLENIISVTAVDNRGELPAFANRGASSVDLAAPGVSVESAFSLRRTSLFADTFGAGLGRWSLESGGMWGTDRMSDGEHSFCALTDPSGPGIPFGPNRSTALGHSFDFATTQAVRVSVSVRLDTQVQDRFSVSIGPGDGAPDTPVLTLFGGHDPKAWQSLFFHLPGAYVGGARSLGFQLRTGANSSADGAAVRSFAVEQFVYADDAYDSADGTSMAAPLVAGTAAMLWAHSDSNALGCTRVQIANAIRNGGTLLPGLTGKTVTGRMLSMPGSLASLACP